MANKKHDTGKVIATKSFYGSHAEMVVDSSEFDVKLSENEVVCVDQDGFYITFKDRLDSGLADPRRFHNKSRKTVQKVDKELDKVET